jgi:hypothetical protein
MPKTKKNKNKNKRKKYINKKKFTKKNRLNKKHKILSNIQRIVNGDGIIQKENEFYYIRVENLFIIDESEKKHNIGNNPKQTLLLAKKVSNKKDVPINISRNEGVGLHITLGYSHKVNTQKLDKLIGSLVTYDIIGFKQFLSDKKYWIVLKIKINTVGNDKNNINNLLNSINHEMLHITIGVGHLEDDL